MTDTRRAILHVDMDAFYASVEQRDNPDYQGRPVIVGGTGRRGVVAAASYEARAFGVFSAMPIVKARRLCPDGVYVRPRMAEYRRVSAQVFKVFRRYTPQVEALSLDEAFLDVTGSQKLHGNAIGIGRQIKQEVRQQTALVASVGVAPNKFLAKLASDHDKPDGFWVVRRDWIRQFLDPLPVKRIWGLGKKSLPALTTLGIHTIADLRQADPARLAPLLGNRVASLQRLAHGEDDRPVVADRADKSVSSEITVDDDLLTLDNCQLTLRRLADQVGTRLRRNSLAGRTVTVKIRTTDFQTYTRSHSLAQGTAETKIITSTALGLMQGWWRQLGPQPIRLLGVGLSNFSDQQADLFGAVAASEIDRLSDQLRRRFGDQAITSATLLADKESRPDDKKQ